MSLEEQLAELKEQIKEVRNSVNHRLKAFQKNIIDLQRIIDANNNTDDASAK